jgi:hypothetical protein
VPIQDSTLRNCSGRSQATVNAQMAPEDSPAMARLPGSLRNFAVFSTSGRISSITKRA